MFLLSQDRDLLFGGAAGPGKSDGLLMAALMYVDMPNYAAILFRRTFPNLKKPGSLIPRSKKWLMGTNANYNGSDHQWTFPSGATLSFGSMQYEDDKFDYNSAEYQFVGFDEAAEFMETQYTFLLSRLRRTQDNPAPLRFRGASNPLGPGYQWVKDRYIEGDKKYIPATLEDNPYIKKKEYKENLQHLDPITREKILNGNWEIAEQGEKFERDWFEIVDKSPNQADRIRYWDMAATERGSNDDPDWTAGAKIAKKDGQYWIEDITRFRKKAPQVEKIIRQTAEMDGKEVKIYMEQEPGSSGKSQISHYARNVLDGFAFEGDKVTGSKPTRANPVASAAGQGNLFLVKDQWNEDFVKEAVRFPTTDEHDDQVDAVSGAFNQLNEGKKQGRVF